MGKVYGFHELAGLIPEKRPLLMIDRIELDVDAGKAVGIKAVTFNEEYFQGHFPNAPIMPGVLQIAAMLQAANALLRQQSNAAADEQFWLSSIKRLKFRKPVMPGDRMFTEVELDHEQNEPDAVTVKAQTRVDGDVTCQGMFTLKRVAAGELQAVAELAPPYPELPGMDIGDVFDIKHIMQAIPHRYPFLLIDRILHLNIEDQHIIALKHVSGTEPFFAGLPAAALPGYMQAEIGAQAGCALALAAPENRHKLAYFMSIDEARFFHPVVPGDQLVMDVRVSGRGRFGRGEGSYWVGNRKVSEIALKFAVVEPEDNSGGEA
jgi:3-hydroxyacyl-[acyl-carrier-protein] dehydratase